MHTPRIRLLSYWGLGLPLGILLAFVLGVGPTGLCWGFLIGLSTVALLLELALLSPVGPAGESGGGAIG